MKLTNKLNLPQPIVDAVKNDGYTKGSADISVTELLKPPMLRALEIEHAEEIEEDVSDRIFSLLGQTVHGILERAENTGIAERRLSIDVNGWKVSGGMDRFVERDGLLQDYKLTTIYKTKDGQIPEEWVKQLNIYAEMLRQNGDKVEKLEVVAIYRDWSKGKSEREYNYPKAQVEVIALPLISSEEVVSFIKERVELHQAAAKGTYEPCTQEERWAKDDEWAVVKEGRKSAIKLHFSELHAQMHADELNGFKEGKSKTDFPISTVGAKHSVVKRPGKSTRCDNYCAVKNFCKYYQTYLKGDENDK